MKNNKDFTTSLKPGWITKLKESKTLAKVRSYVKRFNSGGNYCGHNKLKPTLELSKPLQAGKGGRPALLRMTSKRLEEFYFRPEKVLPSVNAANGSKRQMRSERKEAIVLIGKAIIKHLDLESLRIGMPTADGFVNFTIRYLAIETGMGQKRVERAVADLKKSGILTVEQVRKKVEGKTDAESGWKSVAAVKVVSKDFFAALGLAKMLEKEMAKAAKRLCDKVSKWRQEKFQKATYTGAATLTEQGRNALFDQSEAKKRVQGLRDNQRFHEKNLLLKKAELFLKHKQQWSPERCEAEARRLLLAV